MKYRKKPLVVEAFRLGYDPIPPWGEIAINQGVITPYKINGKYYIEVETLEGVMTAKIGTYIVQGVDGELYPCKASIFEETYEKVEG